MKANAMRLGVRAFCTYRHPSPAPCCFWNWARLHLHDPQASTLGHQARRQESHPGTFLYFWRPARLRSVNVSRLQACLNAPEPAPGTENGVDGESAADSPEEVSHPQIPAPQATMPRGNPGMHPNYITPEQQQQIAYQQYMQQQQQQQQSVGGQYPMPPQARMPHQQQPSG